MCWFQSEAQAAKTEGLSPDVVKTVIDAAISQCDRLVQPNRKSPNLKVKRVYYRRVKPIFQDLSGSGPTNRASRPCSAVLHTEALCHGSESRRPAWHIGSDPPQLG
jgi:hypothetical protein